MKRRTFWILAAGVLLLALGTAAIGVVALVLRRGGQGAPALGSNTSLTLNVAGEMPEAPAAQFGALFEKRPPSLKTLVEEAEARARAQFVEEGIAADKVTLVPFVKCRYQNQEHAVEVQFPGASVNDTTVATLFEKFHDVYQREYTYRLDAPVEIVGLHLVASAEVGKLALGRMPVTGATLASARKGRREVDFRARDRDRHRCPNR